MPVTTKTTTVHPQKQTWKDAECPSYYSNIMQLGLTPFDISVVFGEVNAATSAEVTCTPKAKIILAPEEVANLMQMLAAALQAYTNQFGQLRNAPIIQPTDVEKEQTQNEGG
jgi:Protein of unknown function (DUF3467)